MDKSWGRPALGAWIVLMGFAASAQADTITATYNITIVEHCTQDGCAPFSLAFPLTMTFDSGIIRDEVSPEGRAVLYGAPSFSTIPFHRPPVLPGATESSATFDSTFLLREPTLPAWRRVSSSGQSFLALTEDIEYRWKLSLFADADTATRAELDAQSFVRFLAQGPEDGDPNTLGFFSFGFTGINRHNTSEFTPDSFDLRGFAELATDAAPVPEPGTLLLLTAGLAGLCRRHRAALLRRG